MPYVALITVQACFESLPVIGKTVLTVIPAFALVGFRVVITALILFVVQRFRGGLALADRGDYLRLAVLSLFGVTLNQMFFVGGLSLTKAANASLLAATIPIFTIMAGWFAGTELIRFRTVAGIVLAAVGVLILIDPRNASFSAESTVGDLLIICNSLFYGIYVATSKNTVMRNGALRSITWIFIFASAICGPVGLWSFASVPSGSISPGIALSILYIAVVATAAPYLFNAWALARVSPSIVAVFIYLQPVIGFILAVIFLREHLGAGFFAAVSFIFGGVYMTLSVKRASDQVKHILPDSVQ